MDKKNEIDLIVGENAATQTKASRKTSVRVCAALQCIDSLNSWQYIVGSFLKKSLTKLVKSFSEKSPTKTRLFPENDLTTHGVCLYMNMLKELWNLLPIFIMFNL